MAKRYEGTLGLSPESFFGAACSDERLEVPMPDRESEDLGGTARFAVGTCVLPRRRGCAGPGLHGDRESDASLAEKSIGCLPGGGHRRPVRHRLCTLTRAQLGGGLVLGPAAVPRCCRV